MTKLTETHIEQLAIEELISLGYNYKLGPEIAPDSEHPERESYKDVLLNNRLLTAIQRINPSVPAFLIKAKCSLLLFINYRF